MTGIVKARARRRKELRQLGAIAQSTHDIREIVINSPNKDNSSFLSPSNQTLGSTTSNNPLYQSFHKTIDYLRSSHSSPKISNFADVVSTDGYLDPDAERLQRAFAMEIHKFNKVKLQKQVLYICSLYKCYYRGKQEILIWKK